MPQPRRCAGFAQETKPRRFITEILFADDLQRHWASEIDVERLVSDSHRSATQLHRVAVFARHELVVLKSFRVGGSVWAWPPPRKKTGRTQSPRLDLRGACKPDRIPSLQKARYRNSGRCVGAPFSWI